MATVETNTTDNSTVPFHLATFFDPNEEELAELNEDDIPDGYLLTLMDSVSENFAVAVKKEQLSKSQADDAMPQKLKEKQHFPDITSKECDEIAG